MKSTGFDFAKSKTDRRHMKYFDQNYNGFIFSPDMRVFISIIGPQMDEKYFDSPHEFRPERFSAENKKDIAPCSFQPFGSGPRQCIGAQIAK